MDFLCKACGKRTYPTAWCDCDPRRQLEDHLIAETEYAGVILMNEEDARQLQELSP